MKLKNRDEAVAFAKFLLNERERHKKDIAWIDLCLRRVSARWGVKISFPNCFGPAAVDDEPLTDTWVGLDEI